MVSHSSSAAPRVTFWGAARSVTGSMHLVEANGRLVLLDCGLVRDRHHHAHGGPFPFEPAHVDAVILSHAHIDHCGHLPALVRHGFGGPIYCTPPTFDLVKVMLANSARYHDEDVRVHKVIGRAGADAMQPVFTGSDVQQTLAQCVPVEYGQRWEVAVGIEAELADAGHILGSATIALTVKMPERTARVVFTGDLGRRQPILLREPAPLPEADLIISECTYGSRTLEPLPDTVHSFEEVLGRTIARGGTVLIPAFSLGRTQAVIHCLEQSISAGQVPRVPIYVDSPTAAAISSIYAQHAERLARPADGGVAARPVVNYLYSAEESRVLDERREPAIILAPSGMCDGGRILRHLARWIDDPRCTVLLVNYQAPHTTGRQLLDRGPTVRFRGRKWNKWADVVYLAGFSGHADRSDLLAFLKPLVGIGRVRLVHGEPAEAESLADGLRKMGYTDVEIPLRGDSVDVPTSPARRSL